MIWKSLILVAAVLIVTAAAFPQGIFSTNYRIAQAQGGYYGSYGGRIPGDVPGARPSVDPSAYYSGANRAKISRMLANYYY